MSDCARGGVTVPSARRVPVISADTQMATVFIPALLRKLTAGRESIVASGRTVGQIIDDIERQFPGFRTQLIEHGDLKPSIAVSIDGEIAAGGLLDSVEESSEIHFIPALGGG